MSRSDRLYNDNTHHQTKERRKESNRLSQLVGPAIANATASTTATTTTRLRHRRQATSSSITSSRVKQTAFSPTNNSITSAMSRRQAQSAKINRICNARQLATMLGLVALISGALLLAGSLGARADQDFAQSQLHQHSPAADAYGAGQQQIQVPGTGGNGYEQQQQQHQGPTKAKKIQIVYIKVPLAKLKPSLGHNDSAGSYEGQQKSNDATDTKAQGSQSAADQQQRQISLDELNQFDAKPSQQQQQQLSRPQSLLIPMAVVQTSSDNEQLAEQQPVGPQRLQVGSSNNQLSVAQPNQRGAPRQVSPLSHGINHGFMSSFLSGEKEKMTLAAMRLQQPTGAAASTASPQATSANLQQSSLNPNQNNKPGGLMPIMMMPFSHMPDNAIGQAYNAAVGQALPMESGSPASLMGSPSTQQESGKRGTQTGNNNNNNNNNSGYNGGNSGTSGAASSSPGTGSSGSYGASGLGQQDAGSSASGYQHSAAGFANTGPSSGYGSGTNSFGASVAFSDFPAAHSTGSGAQTYGAQSQQLQASSSSNSNSNNHHHNQLQQGDQQLDYSSQQKLRQAKKTIIPIVVQVEHAILENNQQPQGYPAPGNRLPAAGNKYGGQRAHRQLGGQHKRNRANKGPGGNNNGALYGAATNEIGLDIGAPTGAQFINAANAQDINQITAAINAENAASAAAALAQADMALGAGSPAYIPSQQQQQQRPMHQHQQAGRQYAALQSAASALLANTHPVIQAAASGGLASVSKLGAKLGEMIALPSMQVPQSISSIGASLPSAFSSITNQVGVQLNQAVRQVAKEHPTAHAFARQVAQHAGIALPNFQQQVAPNQEHQPSQQQQMSMAASQQQQVQMSPQAQLQNLKLSIGQNLQSAAAQLMGVHQKANAQSAASLLASPLAALYPQSMNAALKQLSAMQFGPGSQQQVVANMDTHHAQSSSIVPVQQQMNPAQSAQYQQQLLSQQSPQQQQQQQQQQASDIHSPTSQSALLGAGDQAGSSASSKPTKNSSLKSKFLSFFQPPKFISNLLSWNDRADERSDSAPEGPAAKTPAEQAKPEASLESRSAANSTKLEPAASTKLAELKPQPSSNSSAPAVAEQPRETKPELSGSTKPANGTQQASKQN